MTRRSVPRRAGPESACGRSTDRLRLEFWPVDRLVPSARNARTHSDAQVAEIAGSIRAFGFTNPILVGEQGDVVAGHGRLAAARQLGLSDVPVILLQVLTELQRRQLVLADNRIALNAGWDLEMLNLELKDLSALGADLTLVGFTTQELAAALAPAVSTGLTDENEAPALAEAAVTVTGDIWGMGAHRLACGDSTDGDVVRTLRRPALWGGIRPFLASSGGREQVLAGGEGPKRRAGRLGGRLGSVSWQHRIRLARSPPRHDGRGGPGSPRVCDPGTDHLGQGAAGDWARRLSLAARALLVRGAQERQLDRRP
jgi:hypothetical protein